MADKLSSRIIAEHLCTLASLLEAEAIRANALGVRLDKNLSREAREVRAMADKLWEANTTFVVGHELPIAATPSKPKADNVPRNGQPNRLIRQPAHRAASGRLS